ncbi:MAG: hypothetical protein GX322_06875 [Firmicutes bacterium]|nr:hypothetical protein [Bacillota bacterium]
MANIGHMIKAVGISGLAAFLAYAINRLMVITYGERAVKFLIPALEEGLKTSLSLFFQVEIPVVHAFFGAYEALYDLAANPGSRPARRWLAAVAALVGHGLFGYLTWILLEHEFHALIAVGIVGLLHCLWNLFALQSSLGERIE